MRHMLAAVLFLVFSGCVDPNASPEKPPDPGPVLTRVGNISHVLMHETNRFTFFVDQPGTEVGRLEVTVTDEFTKIFRDAPVDGPMYVTYLCENKACNPLPERFALWQIQKGTHLVIHLHSAKEVNSSGQKTREGSDNAEPIK